MSAYGSTTRREGIGDHHSCTYSKNPIGGKTPISLLTGLAFSDELLECVEEGAKAEADAKVRAKGSNRTMFTVFDEEEDRTKSTNRKLTRIRIGRSIVGLLGSS